MSRKLLVKKIGYIPYYREHSFVSNDDPLRDNGNLRYVYLKKRFDESDIALVQYNINEHAQYSAVLFIDTPRLYSFISVVLLNLLSRKPILLILDETPVALPRHILCFSFLFSLILVNGDPGTDSQPNNQIKYYQSSSLPVESELEKILNQSQEVAKKNKMAFIGSYNRSFNRHSSYSKRNADISYLMCKYDDFFDLYGRNWSKGVIPMEVAYYLVPFRLGLFRNILESILLSSRQKKYRRTKSAKSKIETLSRYTFTLAYEPFLGKPYMFLEKLIDPMLAGSIPVYYGPPVPIEVPRNTYIDLRSFRSIDDAVRHLRSMDDMTINGYRRNIREFLQSAGASRFNHAEAASRIFDILAFKL